MGGWNTRPNAAPFLEHAPRKSVKNSTTTSDILGPGSYVGHFDYLTSPNAVAFNCSSPRLPKTKRTIGETIAHIQGRGPGLYNAREQWDTKPNAAPFLEKSERLGGKDGKETKNPTKAKSATASSTHLGPGSYISHIQYEVSPGTCGFGAKEDRFAKPCRNKPTHEGLGPGSYV